MAKRMPTCTVKGGGRNGRRGMKINGGKGRSKGGKKK
jgi:hypothetical protein